MIILFAIVAGALSYASAQFLWYAPFAFGPYRLAFGGETEASAADQALAEPGRAARIGIGVVLPAFLSSCALVALKGMTDQFSLTAAGFVLAVLALGLAVVLPKYLVGFWKRQRPNRLLLIQDGALLFGLLGAAFAIIGSGA